MTGDDAALIVESRRTTWLAMTLHSVWQQTEFIVKIA